MEYAKFDKNYYIRMDKGDEIVGCILDLCKKENIGFATYSGIGGCGKAEIQTFIPEQGRFETHTLKGMLELVSLTGNVTVDEGFAEHHTHAVFAYIKDGEHSVDGGHLKSTTVLLTAEIELRPTAGGTVKRKLNPETGTGFWDFD